MKYKLFLLSTKILHILTNKFLFKTFKFSNTKWFLYKERESTFKKVQNRCQRLEHKGLEGFLGSYARKPSKDVLIKGELSRSNYIKRYNIKLRCDNEGIRSSVIPYQFTYSHPIIKFT